MVKAAHQRTAVKEESNGWQAEQGNECGQETEGEQAFVAPATQAQAQDREVQNRQVQVKALYPGQVHCGHFADWRVRPNQVMVSIGNEVDIEVVCAFGGCPIRGRVRTERRQMTDPDDPTTWRRFTWGPDDHFTTMSLDTSR